MTIQMLNRWRSLKMPLLSCWLLVMDVHIFHQQFNLLERATNLLQRFLHFYSSCTVSGSMTLLNNVLILVYLPIFFFIIVSVPSNWYVYLIFIISLVSLLILRSCSKMRLQSKRPSHLQFHKTSLWYVNSGKLYGYGLFFECAN